MYGLILHKIFYPNEVKSFADIGVPSLSIGDKERDLADLLVDKFSNDTLSLSIDDYKDEATERIQNAVQKKINGEDISYLPTPVKANIVDLVEQLKASITGWKLNER